MSAAPISTAPERWRRPAFYAAGVVGFLVVTQLLLPGPGGSGGRGTPMAILFGGLVNGMVSAVSACGVVLVYRTLRIINFAQTTLGLAGALICFALVQMTEVPFIIALPVGLALSAAVGVLVGVVLLRFQGSSRLVLTVVTILGTGLLATLSLNVYELPFFPDFEDLPADLATGSAPLKPYLPFAGWEFGVGDYPTPFGFQDVAAIELCALALLALGAFFRYTRAGVAVRAMAENPQRASLLGIGVGGLSITVWVVASLLSGVTTISTGMLNTPTTAGGFAPVVLLTAFAAAVLGRMERFGPTIAASIGIGVLIESFEHSFPTHQPLVNVGLFVLLTVALLLQRNTLGRSESGQGVSWSAVEEQRRVPSVLASLAPVRAARWGVYVAGLAVLLLVPFAFSTGVVFTASVVCLTSIVGISVVVLTGWGGQVSLGQFGFAAVGAVVGGALTATLGLPFWIAVPLATVVSGAVAVVVGLPALRIPGLFLLPVTFAFAVAVQSIFFDRDYFGWLLPTDAIERPSFFFLDFRDETSMYFLCVASLLLAIVVVGNLRRSRTGRILIALRENEANVQSFGVNVVRTKLLAFAISGGLAGFAGSILVHQQQGLSVESFNAFRSVTTFTAVVFGGVGSVAGALLGATYFAFVSYFEFNALVAIFSTNGGALLLVMAYPGGLISLVNAARDSVLRVIAQRRQIVVPSLFADVDPDALDRMLVPLAEPDPASGLSVLPAGTRFELVSELYRGRVRRAVTGRRNREREAIGSAATNLAAEGS